MVTIGQDGYHADGNSTRRATKAWQDSGFAAAWTDGDTWHDFLAFPRRLATGVVAQSGTDPALVVDVGSGPGAFLDEFLTRFPHAHGLWLDVADEMLSEARERLAQHGSRVDFQIRDMTDPAALDVVERADVVVSSRASHHLTGAELATFYTDAAARLSPGGWLINLDHVGVEPVWQERLKTVRSGFMTPNPSPHPHPNPMPTLQEHLRAYASAGITDVDVPWRAFYTCLVTGRKNA